VTRPAPSITCGVLAIALLLSASLAEAQDASKTYTDSRGRQVVFPLGEASFADEVVSFAVGTPPPRDPRWADPRTALGPPDFNPKRVDPRHPADVVLGCGGALIVRFADNVLVDVTGPDLYVFEVGPAIEPMTLAISQDGAAWTEVGDIRGGTAAIDIAKVAKPGERYRFVRVTDLKRACGAPYPGADVDAVGAIGSALQLSLDASVLFEFDQSTLLARAQSALVDAAATVAAHPGAAIVVEGHTDNRGGDAYNARLSQARAESVRTFLLARPELKGFDITARGFGAARPVAPNDSDAGRQQNRRVEIVVTPRS
jgi:outer membrane protein OmpA-like peptidoglycan-associated protein